MSPVHPPVVWTEHNPTFLLASPSFPFPFPFRRRWRGGDRHFQVILGADRGNLNGAADPLEHKLEHKDDVSGALALAYPKARAAPPRAAQDPCSAARESNIYCRGPRQSRSARPRADPRPGRPHAPLQAGAPRHGRDLALCRRRVRFYSVKSTRNLSPG